MKIATTACLALALCASAPRDVGAEEPTMLITGRVEAATGEFVSRELGRFQIAADGQGEELLRHDGEIVTVNGVVEEARDGVKHLHVDRFQRISEE